MIDFQLCLDPASSSFFSLPASWYGIARTDIEMSVLAKHIWESPEKKSIRRDPSSTLAVSQVSGEISSFVDDWQSINLWFFYKFGIHIVPLTIWHHLSFCSLTSPTCSNSPRKCHQLNISRGKQLGFQMSHIWPQYMRAKEDIFWSSSNISEWCCSRSTETQL